MMKERKRNKRSNNIVIKRVEIEKEKKIDNKWVENFVKEVTDSIVKMIECRLSGKMIVATLEQGDMKEIAMKKKNRLRSKKIFIENDLIWKERKIQERRYISG